MTYNLFDGIQKFDERVQLSDLVEDKGWRWSLATWRPKSALQMQLVGNVNIIVKSCWLRLVNYCFYILLAKRTGSWIVFPLAIWPY
jgi:hypothetical protein